MIDLLAWTLLAVVLLLVLSSLLSVVALAVLLVSDAVHAVAGWFGRLRGYRLPVPQKRPVG